MGIFLRQSHNVKPVCWGSPADVQYSIRRNMESIYKCDPDNDVLVMPLFWGLPCLDYSKFGNHGTNHGATYKDGSLDFDGEDEYIDNGYNPSLDFSTDDKITVSAWIKPTGTINDYQRIVSSQYNNDVTAGCIFQLGIHSAGEWRWSVSNIFDISPATPVPVQNTMYYFVGVYDAGANHAVMYVDGDSIWSSSSFSTGIRDNLNNLPITIGAQYHVSPLYDFNGLIDEVRISKAVRTPDQIGLFYENPYGLYRRVVKPIWSIPAAPSIYIPQIIMF